MRKTFSLPKALQLACLLGATMGSPPLLALDFSDIAKEGELRFLVENPDPKGYWYSSRVALSEESLRTGEVSLETCHHQLDPIRKVVIAFNPQRLIGLSVSSHQGIETIESEAHRVTLSNVQRGAHICIALQSRALDQISPSQWRLQAGPLMRRYFDGYLPMKAELRVSWPRNLLRLESTQPTFQPGVSIVSSESGAEMLTVFAGRFSGFFLLNRPD
jgi:hypothetical protein